MTKVWSIWVIVTAPLRGARFGVADADPGGIASRPRTVKSGAVAASIYTELARAAAIGKLERPGWTYGNGSIACVGKASGREQQDSGEQSRSCDFPHFANISLVKIGIVLLLTK